MEQHENEFFDAVEYPQEEELPQLLPPVTVIPQTVQRQEHRSTRCPRHKDFIYY